MTQKETNMNAGSVGNEFKQTLKELTNKLLDEFYSDTRNSNSYGTSYETARDTREESILIGRENGSNGAESDVGFDYFYRSFFDNESLSKEYEYYYGKYGWMDIHEFENEIHILRQLYTSAIEDGYLNDSDLDRFETAASKLETDIRTFRESYNLRDIEQLLVNNDIDTLRPLLCHGDEEGRVIWQLLFSKDETGDVIQNTITTPVVSESDQFLFAKTERFYYDDRENEGSWYDYGVIIGYDDTPQRFFVHRLESDTDLRDENTNWTPQLLKEKLGFDYNIHEIETDDFPYQKRIRIQGDLVLIRHDFDVIKQQSIEERLRQRENRFLRDNREMIEEKYGRKVKPYSRSIRFNVKEDTESIKEFQSEHSISEDRVRQLQDERGYSRLTAKRRKEIVKDCIRNDALEMCYENTDSVRREVKREVREDVTQQMQNTNEQMNRVIGNHTAIISNADDYRGVAFDVNTTEASFVVPDESMLFVLHDEHTDKRMKLQRGVYTIQFLNGFEDQWWMDN